jgi:hypothetical protein
MTIQHREDGRRNMYHCPMCPEKGWMTGGAMWQHLRGTMHQFTHEEASETIEVARNPEEPAP